MNLMLILDKWAGFRETNVNNCSPDEIIEHLIQKQLVEVELHCAIRGLHFDLEQANKSIRAAFVKNYTDIVNQDSTCLKRLHALEESKWRAKNKLREETSNLSIRKQPLLKRVK